MWFYIYTGVAIGGTRGICASLEAYSNLPKIVPKCTNITLHFHTKIGKISGERAQPFTTLSLVRRGTPPCTFFKCPSTSRFWLCYCTYKTQKERKTYKGRELFIECDKTVGFVAIVHFCLTDPILHCF